MATVLVVDPSLSLRETLRIVLAAEHDVVIASSLDEVAPGTAPDLVALGLPPRPRDDQALGRSLERVAPAVPVLLLHAAGDVALHHLVAPHRPIDFLTKPFDAYGVRARVRVLLAAAAEPIPNRAVESHRRYLEFPYLSQAAAAQVQRALGVHLPVTLQGEPGTGALAVARALHELGRMPGVFAVRDTTRSPAGGLTAAMREMEGRGGGTLFLGALDRSSSDIQYELLACLDQEAERRAPIRVVAGAREDVGELASRGGFLAELAYRLTTLAIELAPLRDRRDDIAHLAEALSAGLAHRIGLASVTFTPAALDRLTNYLWFGNVAELEAVLGRTLAVHRAARIDVEHLVMMPDDATGALAGRTGGRARPAAPAAPPAPLTTPNLEIVLGELANELRNPMVTIKTFAQHLDSVLADADARQRFSILTSEAVDRMDTMLETLLDFARFRAPVARPTDLRAMLDQVLGEHAEDLARRHVAVERNGAAMGTVAADEAQVLFAFRSLLRGLVPDLVTHSPLKVCGVEPGVVELQVRTDPSTAERLKAWVEPAPGDPATTPPLAWALAASLLQRNGGVLGVRREADATTIRIAWSQQRT